MGNKLGDLPTMKLGREELAEYAREADKRALESESSEVGVRETGPPTAGEDVDFEISVEVAFGDPEAEGDVSHETAPPFDPDDAPTIQLPHDISPVSVASTRDPTVGPELASVPFVVASREDLSWFELEETSNVVLAMIDGEATVGSIVNALALPHASSLAILRELRDHGVIEFL
jgi:hypothetical protein